MVKDISHYQVAVAELKMVDEFLKDLENLANGLEDDDYDEAG
jgi:hypothetical protein